MITALTITLDATISQGEGTCRVGQITGYSEITSYMIVTPGYRYRRHARSTKRAAVYQKKRQIRSLKFQKWRDLWRDLERKHSRR